MRITKQNRILLLVAGILFSAAVIVIGGNVYAKYITQTSITGYVTIKVDIGTITLQEHKAVREEDGSYVLLDEGECAEEDVENVHEHVTSNSYVLIPGLDIPKDPHVVVEKENDMPVYVFVEIVEGNPNSAITYSVSDEWIELTGVEGKIGKGKVYVYKDPETSLMTVTEGFTSYILKNNIVTVGQELIHGNKEDLGLVIYASMYQIYGNKTPTEIYTSSSY